jgi:hypothetical protein
MGYQLFVRDKTLFFRPPAHAEPPAVTLTLGEKTSAFLAPGQRTRPGDRDDRPWLSLLVASRLSDQR